MGSGSLHFQNYLIQDSFCIFEFKVSFCTGNRRLGEIFVFFFEKGEEKYKNSKKKKIKENTKPKHKKKERKTKNGNENEEEKRKKGRSH